MSKFGFDKILKNWDKTKEEIAKELLVVTKEYFVKNFKSQNTKDTMNEAWSPLSEQYKKQKSKAGYGNKPTLQRTGKLLSALMNSIKTGSSKWSDCKLVVSNEYGIFHNKGTNKMPRRTFVLHTTLLEKVQIDSIYKQLNKIFK